MKPERTQIRFLLDEHYPGWLAEDLAADGIDAIALTAHRPGLRGVDDQRVLVVAVRRAGLWSLRMMSLPSARQQLSSRIISGLCTATVRGSLAPRQAWRLRKALVVLAVDPPAGLGEYPVVWLAEPSSQGHERLEAR
jgi:hypothetical protein